MKIVLPEFQVWRDKKVIRKGDIHGETYTYL